MTTSVRIDSISTSLTPPEQRCQFWESYNGKQLIGLRCSTFSDEGFIASGKNIHIDNFGIAFIRANEHVVERNIHIVKDLPKESIFFSLGLSSHSFFYQGKECFKPDINDLIIYRTDKPYLFGFSSNMKQLTFDIPYERHHLLFKKTINLDTPRIIKSDTKKNRFLIKTLYHLGMQYLEDPNQNKAETFKHEIIDLLGSILSENFNDSDTLGLSYLIAAKHYIFENLHNPDLSCEEIAMTCELSSRHLTRIFAQENTSPKQYIILKRLERAAQLLSSSEKNYSNISEIAYQCGFSNQAHFSRAFKIFTGMSPKEYRKLNLI
ncbi:helix-turn-helix domain-containing protein [Marinomonas shanghaiensis]|uniref:helix-turn-helix domain-containing protein n=1 Tax=Marinomonas shanghaiensis TaxID=2202418 RepID=UPI003A8C9E34